MLLTQSLSRIGTVNSSSHGFWGALILGGLIGIIWTPCAGPILAAVVVQAILQKTNFYGFLTVLSFGIGSGTPMLVIALLGRKIMNRSPFFQKNATLFRKILGGIIILSLLFLIYDSYSPPAAASTQNQAAAQQEQLVDGLADAYSAPAIAGIEAWINSPPLSLEQLKGKVILIDFWTYSCINCLRTLPYLKAWYAAYHDKGLEIIGVHSPEFEFEKNRENVKNAVQKLKIFYPVALDNNFVTWQNYQNRYWPAHYLIDQQGKVVYQHFGEGEYDTTENNIRFLLGVSKPLAHERAETSIGSFFQTPETYFGYARAANFYSPEIIAKESALNYSYPAQLPLHGWALQGLWKIAADKITAMTPGASIKLHFRAKNIYAVLGSAGQKTILVKVKINDGPKGDIKVTQHELYTLGTFPQQNEGYLELTATAAGLEMYTFTFG